MKRAVNFFLKGLQLGKLGRQKVLPNFIKKSLKNFQVPFDRLPYSPTGCLELHIWEPKPHSAKLGQSLIRQTVNLPNDSNFFDTNIANENADKNMWLYHISHN